MAKVRIIQNASDKLSATEIANVLHVNFNRYIETTKIDETEKQNRFSICASCEHLTFRAGCKIIGSCRSGRQDFYQMHLNREQGGCPIGQW